MRSLRVSYSLELLLRDLVLVADEADRVRPMCRLILVNEGQVILTGVSSGPDSGWLSVSYDILVPVKRSPNQINHTTSITFHNCHSRSRLRLPGVPEYWYVACTA